MNDALHSAKEDAAANITAVIQLCSNMLKGAHVEQGTKSFATDVIDKASSAGQALASIVETTGDAKDVVRKYVEDTAKASPDPADLLMALQESHIDIGTAGLKLPCHVGQLSEMLAMNFENGTAIDKRDAKLVIGRIFQQLAAICRVLDIDFIDAMLLNIRELRVADPEAFKEETENSV